MDVFTDHKSLQYVFTQKKLNLCQRILLDVLKDYDMTVLYHSGKSNMVVDALSCMTMVSVTHVKEGKKDLVKDVIDWLGWVIG